MSAAGQRLASQVCGRERPSVGEGADKFLGSSLQTSFVNAKGAAGSQAVLFLVDFPFSVQFPTFLLEAEGRCEGLGLDQQLLSCCTTFKAIGLLTQHFCRFPVHVLHGAPCTEQLCTAQTLPDWPGGDGVPVGCCVVRGDNVSFKKYISYKVRLIKIY